MAAKPKLSQEQWAEVRAKWENDSRKGFPWLAEEMGLPVSAEALRLRSKTEGWEKQNSNLGESKKQVKTKLGKNAESKFQIPKTSNVVTVENPTETQFDPFDQLTDKQEIFVREYVVDWNATQAAIRAGYSKKSAGQIGERMLKNVEIQNAISLLSKDRAQRLEIDADELMRGWASVVSFDSNEISQLRRVCCPCCHGKDHQRQYTPLGLESAKRKHELDRAKILSADSENDIGEFPDYDDEWYDKRKPPNPDCPECFGDGIAEVFLADTRNLSPAARMVFAGVKDGRDGIEILTMSKEKAADNMARALGLFKEKETEVNINMVSGSDLYRLYEEKMATARERQAAVLAERGADV